MYGAYFAWAGHAGFFSGLEIGLVLEIMTAILAQNRQGAVALESLNSLESLKSFFCL